MSEPQENQKKIIVNHKYVMEKFITEKGYISSFVRETSGDFYFRIYKINQKRFLFLNFKSKEEIARLSHDVGFAGERDVGGYSLNVLDRRFISELEKLADDFSNYIGENVSFVVKPFS